ncbi:hypothetical protein FSP39_024509, partial [Pinctada imbricata]
GSKLYEKSVEQNKNLAVNIRVADWSSVSSAVYFRAHPVLTACIQTVFTKVLNATSSKATMVKAYEPVSSTGSYSAIEQTYLSSGCGVKMGYRSGSGDLNEIARAALKGCTMKFEAIQRDIGIHILSDGVLIFMVGGSDTQPSYDGILASVAQGYINEGLVPQKIPDCSPFTGLDRGQYFPDGKTNPDDVVGEVDIPVTKSMDTDFRRFVQYLGTDVDFEDDNGAGCNNGYIGNSVNKRCDDRLMSGRMYSVLYYLKSYVNDAGSGLSSKIKVTEAWDDGSENPNSLFTEGRAIKITYPSANTEANLKIISQLAICAKADYVAHNSDHLLITVRKQKGRTEQEVVFTKANLVAVEPPSTSASSYSLDPEMADEEDTFPLFDSKGQTDILLDDDAPVSKFIAKDTDFRYFRVDPAVVKCYSRLVYQENKWNSSGNVNILIDYAFMSNEEQSALIQSSDERYNRHNLGQALQLRYDAPSDNYTLVRLTKKIIDVCGPIFNSSDSNINVGLYTDFVYVGMDEEFFFWANDPNLIPSQYNGNESLFSIDLEARMALAIQSRIVDPDYPDEACNEPYIPERQRLDYRYKEPLVQQRKRRRKRSTPDQCVPTENTAFCTETLPHRQAIVDALWHEMSVVKHVYHEPAEEVKEALEGCFLTCGTCLEGYIYEKKVENCSNLIHWIPFDLLNDALDDSNFYARDNLDTYTLACEGSGHCLVEAPLFSRLAPSVKKTYRPDPERSVVEEVYSSEENPSPLIRLLDELYAVHANGIAKFWVANEQEMTSMKDALTAAMMFNQNVSSIHIYVTNEASESPVQAVVEAYATKMSSEGCPYYTREILAPYEITKTPERSRLFSFSAESGKNLDVNLRVTQFNQVPASLYFRAHPAFVSCLQITYSAVFNDTGEKVQIEHGYEPISNSSQYADGRALYLSSGCGAVLQLSSGNVQDIIRAALRNCPFIFETYQRDIGIEVLGSSVLVYMTGDVDDSPQFTGVTETVAMGYISEGQDPAKIPDCSNLSELDRNTTYPSGMTDPASIVGDVDSPITSSSDPDFTKIDTLDILEIFCRLVQYLGNDIDFEDTEGYGCSSRYTGNSIDKRCPDRLMSARMFDVITDLKAYVSSSSSLTGSLLIYEAWDNGTEYPNTLHTEGRAVRMRYQPVNSEANLKKLSQLAICAGADFVQHNDDHLFLAVKKQRGRSEQSVSFPTMTLLAVDSPSTKLSSYSLPQRMSGVEEQYPLFDSDGMLDQFLADDAPVSTFVSRDSEYRYFRVDKAIVQCYSKLVFKERRTSVNGIRHYSSALEVVYAFMSNDEQDTQIQIGQPRYNTHTLGQALELKYVNNSINNTRLLLNIVDVCGPEFDSFGFNMKLGLYWSSVYVGISDQFSFWANPETKVPSGYNESSYGSYLDARRTLAIEERIVYPDDFTEACTNPDVPKQQDIYYRYSTPLNILRKQTNRTTHACNVTSGSSFCSETLSYRQTIVTSLWNTMSSRKTVLHNPQNEVKTALEGCFLACGTCMEGEIWEEKIEHCSNLIHWAPFDLLNEGTTTNIFSRDNPAAYTQACQKPRHCVQQSPLFSQLAPSITQTYRPDPSRSAVEDLYSAVDNPSPLLELLDEMYVMHASGIINFWVQDEKEMTSMLKTIQAALLYNKDVDEVHIYVLNDISKTAVYNVVQASAKRMATEGCPTYTREMVAPFKVLSIP